ncbi:isoprenoid synthase domain-containing protein [Bipolaris maydis]|nr:isoprenoid synthase domain-containing protein [Bipolaris maydis]KAJ6202094.1 isoprenoid synthase domain-containing protein [Bipolaris maydis]
MAHSTHTTARDVIAEIKGQSLVLPDLWQYMPADDWPVDLNPDMQRLRKHLRERFQGMIERIPSKRRGLRKVEAQDLGRFGAGWWPYADFERMETCTDLCAWLFIWDDAEIDEAEGEFNSDYEHAQRCREDIIHFVRELLDLPPYRKVNTSFRPILETSRDVWQRLRKDMTLHERHNLAKEIRIYLEMVGYEQGLRVDQSLPTLEEYWRLRMATSAVKITTAALLSVYHRRYSAVKAPAANY